MASPFPGMDPFLESQACFPDLHHGLIVFMQQALQMRLPEPYYAATNTRVWLEFSRRVVEPDIDLLRANGARQEQSTSGGVAVACQVRTPPVVVQTEHDPIEEVFLEIYTQGDGQRLVTSIEVLSLSNKTPGHHGSDLYRQKQREVLGSEVHLIEIDLLRRGEHTTAIPRELALAEAGPFDYHVCVRDFTRLGTFYVYPIQLEKALPEIIVPLLPGDPAVAVDLQEAFTKSYEAGGYPRRVRYAEAVPPPPLLPDKAEWVRQVLRAKGLVPAAGGDA